MNDARITGQPEFPDEHSKPADLPPLPSLTKARPPLWTQPQIGLVGGSFLATVAALLVLLVLNFDYVRILWSHPAGIKMSFTTLAQMAISTMIYLAVMFALNRALLDKGRRTAHATLSVLFGGIYVLFCLCAGLFTFVTGPAAIQIMDHLSQPGP
jgi:hypothetical protein